MRRPWWMTSAGKDTLPQTLPYCWGREGDIVGLHCNHFSNFRNCDTNEQIRITIIYQRYNFKKFDTCFAIPTSFAVRPAVGFLRKLLRS